MHMNLSACCEHVAQGVLFAESGAHERQSASAIPTQPPQTALILRYEFATFYVFNLLLNTFSGKTFHAPIWPVLISGI